MTSLFVGVRMGRVICRSPASHGMVNATRILLMVVARHLGANDLPEIYDAFKAEPLRGLASTRDPFDLLPRQ